MIIYNNSSFFIQLFIKQVILTSFICSFFLELNKSDTLWVLFHHVFKASICFPCPPFAKPIPSLLLSPPFAPDKHCLWSEGMEACNVSVLFACSSPERNQKQRPCLHIWFYSVVPCKAGHCSREPAGLSLPAEVSFSLNSAFWRDQTRFPGFLSLPLMGTIVLSELFC